MRCGLCGVEGHRKGSKECSGIPMETIEIKESNKWTEEQYVKLKNLVIGYGLEVNWDEISKEMNRTPETCKLKYNEIVDTKERLEIKLGKLNNQEIEKIIGNSKKTCQNEDCSYIFYCEPFKWKTKDICEKCYKKTYEERCLLWTKVRNNVEEKDGYRCKFCGMEDVDYSCHFDHINMFNKSDSVCNMVNRGDNIEIIIEEVDKCQLICKSCHSIVTEIERKLGFHSAKSNITRKENNGIIDDYEINQLEKEKEELEVVYEGTMDKIYDFLRK